MHPWHLKHYQGTPPVSTANVTVFDVELNTVNTHRDLRFPQSCPSSRPVQGTGWTVMRVELQRRVPDVWEQVSVDLVTDRQDVLPRLVLLIRQEPSGPVLESSACSSWTWLGVRVSHAVRTIASQDRLRTNGGSFLAQVNADRGHPTSDPTRRIQAAITRTRRLF